MKTIIKYIALHRIFLIIMALSCSFLVPTLRNPIHRGDIDFEIVQGDHIYPHIENRNIVKGMWTVWDSKWYLSIAADGYSNQKKPYEEIDNKAFMPLYPLLIAIVMRIVTFGDSALAGILVSNIFLILSLIMVNKFIDSDEKLKHANINMKDYYLYTLFFPLSYYLSSVYSESLFLFLSTTALYFINTKKMKSAAMMIGLAAITKIYALFLLIPLVFYIYKNRKNISIPNIFYSLLLIGIPMLIYLLIIYQVSGDFFAYNAIQNLFFKHEWSNPIEVFLLDIFYRVSLQTLFNGIGTILGLALIYLGRKHIQTEHGLYAAAYLGFTPFTGMTSSNVRYMTSLVFIPLILCLVIKKNEHKMICVSLMAFVQGFTLLWWLIGNGFIA